MHYMADQTEGQFFGRASGALFNGARVDHNSIAFSI